MASGDQNAEPLRKLRLLNITGERLLRLQRILERDRRLVKLFFSGKISSVEFTDGTAFSEHYDFLQVLGAGAFGLVFSAKERRSGEVCAVKTLSKELMAEEDVTALKSECEVLRRARHANVVRLFGVSLPAEFSGR